MPEQRTKPTRDAVQGCRRAYFPVENFRAVDEEKRTVEVAFSSDAELEQWFRTKLVLEHTAEAVSLKRLNDGGAVLFNHNRNDHIGVVESARVDADGKCRAIVRFGSGVRSTEKFKDVQDGILRHISVGFDIHEVKLVETRDDDMDVYRATSWEPYEISFVTIPLDHSVGVGRDNTFKEGEMLKPNGNPEAAGGVDESAIRENALNVERERTNTLLKMGRDYGAPDEAQEFVSEGKSPDQFRQFLLDKLDARGKANETTPDEMNDPIGLSEREIQNFSVLKALRALANPASAKAREAASFEFEVSAAAAERMGRDTEGIVVPPEVLAAPVKRTYTTGTDATPHGGATVATNLLSGSFIDMLRNRSLLLSICTHLAGLVGNIAIPKQIAGATGYVIGEDEGAPNSEGDFGQVKMSPSTIAAMSELSRRLLMQSSLDVEALVRGDLALALALKTDYLGYYGSGTDEPRGIKNTNGVNAITFATATKPTHAELVQMETEISADNADIASMAYHFGPRMRGHFKTTLKNAGVAGTIWEPGNTVNGYNTGVTNQIATDDAFFGNFSDLIVGLWGGLELTVDPFTHSDKGRVRVVAMQDCDFALRHGESFCYGTKPA